jgi:hypothetical protein
VLLGITPLHLATSVLCGGVCTNRRTAEQVGWGGVYMLQGWKLDSGETYRAQEALAHTIGAPRAQLQGVVLQA